MVLLEFSMYPTDRGASVSEYVGRSLEIIDDSGLPYRLGPMGTTLEGEWDEVLAVVTRCFERMRQDCERVAVTIKVDYRRGPGGRLESKVAAVKARTGRDLRT
ncbi:MAG TPA: MTH1187 family thiamine-binding protein [Candidatus Krumholzibacteria bacterium]|nr:MTH1187 family thiamine-binding protein [Candidatus Krumholzibacteria bacterium]HPD71033.1 MTH1187 family thiamine-binding protein [Candidatus Krumholzibacteria bacterium]HRY39267.1 MTH1187 family thiamine-binding protein [Candidatus Krumholzibacteria bacterium]